MCANTKCWRCVTYSVASATRADALRRRIGALLVATSGGILLCAGAIVAPLLFAVLAPDRLTAGRIAARVFEASYWCAGVAALAILVFRVARSRIDVALGASLAGCAALELVVIAPAIARHGEGWPLSFAVLHGLAGGLHLLMTLGAWVLAWRLSGDAAMK